MKNQVKIVFSVLALMSFQCYGSLVENGNFATGNFTDWTVTDGTSGDSDLSVRSGSSYSPTGAYGASFAQFGSPTAPYDTISQTIPVIVGDLYDITFELQNNAGPDDAFIASFGGTTLLNLVNVSAFSFVEESFSGIAPGNGVLKFSGYQNPAQFALTDISVTDAGPAPKIVPEPTTIISGAMVLLPFGSSAVRQLRKKLKGA
jgi:hypothetical protein